MKVTFNGWKCNVLFGKYSNGRIGFELVDDNDGEPVATCTINIPSEKLEKDEVIVKDYSENYGMLEALQKAGIVSDPIRYVESGFITAPVCKLLKQ